MSLPDFVPVARRFAPSFVHIATSYAHAGPALSYGEIFDFSVPPIPGYDGKAVVDAEALPGLVANTAVGRNVALYISRHGIIESGKKRITLSLARPVYTVG